jgi:DNA-binding MarR family transcriptional regulator
LQKRSIAAAPLDHQSGQLVGYLETLFQRMMLPRRPPEDEGPDCSREEIRALVVLGSHGRSIMSSLAEALGVPLSTATHTVDRLVARDLVVRKRSEEDRRIVEVEISDYGRKAQETFRRRRRAMARSWLLPLSPAERENFLELMEKITRLARPLAETGPKVAEAKPKAVRAGSKAAEVGPDAMAAKSR